MAENVPPATMAAANGTTTATASGTSADQSSTRGLPYYEKLRRELRDTIAKKRIMDKNLAALEETIYTFEQNYLEETGAGNIIKGFDNYIKGATTASSLSATGSGVGASFNTGGGGGSNGRKRTLVSDADRVFSKSSVSFMRESPGPSSTSTSVAPTPTFSGPGKDSRDGSTGKAGSKKNKKSGSASRNPPDDEDDSAETGPKPPAKRLKITYSRGGVD